MTGAWLVSYLVLWIVVLCLVVVVLGLLRELGRVGVFHRASPHEVPAFPALHDDGPPLGSLMPAFRLPTLHRSGEQTNPATTSRGKVLVAVLTPLCEGCQDVVEALNTLPQVAPAVQPVAVLSASMRQAEAFQKVFPFSIFAVIDPDGQVMRDLGIKSAPFGLLYEQGHLARKARIHGGASHILALLGIPSDDDTESTRVYPESSGTGV